MDTPNREQRRRAKFGNSRGASEPWPDSTPNPAFDRPAGDQAAHTGTPDQDVTHQTGSGTGGATEGDQRVIDREGIHGSNTAKT